MNLFAAVQRRLAPETRRLDEADRARLFEWTQRNMKVPPRLFVGLTVGIVVSCTAAWPIGQWLAQRSPAPPWSGLAIPLIAFAPMWVFFFFVFRERRRWVRRGMNALGYPTCIACGYDLAGLHQDRCPECGAGVERVEVDPAKH